MYVSTNITESVENTVMHCCLLIFTPEQISSEFAVLSPFLKQTKKPNQNPTNSSMILF